MRLLQTNLLFCIEFYFIILVATMKNFIRKNIENIKGAQRAASIQRQNPKSSTLKYQSVIKNTSIQQRVSQLQKKLSKVDQNHQQQIIQQLTSIKQDIRLIKSHIFEQKFSSAQKQQTQQSQQDQNFISSRKQRMKSQSSQLHDAKIVQKSIIHNQNKIVALDELIQARTKRSHSNYHKNSINLKTIASMIKEYKLEEPDFATIFYGYSKKNSQLVAVKYSLDGLGQVLQIYDRLWKNIAKAKWPCVNRILDFRREDTSYIIMQKNKGNIVGLPPKAILIDTLKIIEFIHDCGYLYRNIEPQHLMLNQDGQLVLIDFKRAKRYIDIKGHPLEVIDSYNGSSFASNNQLRGFPQSRKDDLQSLGYLALLLLELQIPWFGCNKQQTIKIRSSLTLQSLFKSHSKWVQYMAIVMRTPKGQRPDYKLLLQILQLS